MKYVYVLRSKKTGKQYVGFTKDLRARVEQHNKGVVTSTKHGQPWTLLYYEAHTSENDAMRREKYLKTTQGKRALKRMLREALNIN